MKTAKSVMLMLVLTLNGGCATQPNTENAIRIIAFGADDRAQDTDIEKLADSDVMAQGLVYEFQAGDIIRLSIEIGGNLAEATQAEPIDILLKRKLWLFANDDGWWASLDGKDFRRFDKLSDGSGSNSSVSVGLGTNKEEKSNDLKIRLEINPS